MCIVHDDTHAHFSFSLIFQYLPSNSAQTLPLPRPCNSPGPFVKTLREHGAPCALPPQILRIARSNVVFTSPIVSRRTCSVASIALELGGSVSLVLW